MSGFRISEAARATGFTKSALRFYEQEGVVVPERTASGYRSYQKEDVESLRFVARCKKLGLSLEEIIELLALLERDECGPLQARMIQMVNGRISQAQDTIGQLIGFTAQLQEAAARLGLHTPQGACNENCGCRAEPAVTKRASRKAVPLVASTSSPVACSLEPGLVAGRVDDWRAMVAKAEHHEPLSDGICLRFPRETDVTALSRLAASEQTCCDFFTFTIGIHADHVTLGVSGPPEAQPVITTIFGAAA